MVSIFLQVDLGLFILNLTILSIIWNYLFIVCLQVHVLQWSVSELLMQSIFLLECWNGSNIFYRLLIHIFIQSFHLITLYLLSKVFGAFLNSVEKWLRLYTLISRHCLSANGWYILLKHALIMEIKFWISLKIIHLLGD